MLVDVCEHAGGSLEGVVGGFEAGVFGAVLVGGVAGEDGGDVEYYGGLFVGERVLGCGFVGEGVEPVMSCSISINLQSVSFLPVLPMERPRRRCVI